MTSIVNKWKIRAGEIGNKITLFTHRGSFSGNVNAVSDDGALTITDEQNENLVFHLSEFIEESEINQ